MTESKQRSIATASFLVMMTAEMGTTLSLRTAPDVRCR